VCILIGWSASHVAAHDAAEAHHAIVSPQTSREVDTAVTTTDVTAPQDHLNPGSFDGRFSIGGFFDAKKDIGVGFGRHYHF